MFTCASSVFSFWLYRSWEAHSKAVPLSMRRSTSLATTSRAWVSMVQRVTIFLRSFLLSSPLISSISAAIWASCFWYTSFSALSLPSSRASKAAFTSWA